jgi:MFS family permease
MSDAQTYPAPRISWALVSLLTIAYVLSYVDRSILGLLIEPVKADVHLSDEQMGYLIGPAFAIFYATMGLPLGWMADRKRRTWIVSAGVALWSLATMASGLANSFIHLFVARMSVGVGEATLSPCAMSMIGDSFPPEKRGRPVALYSSALSLGAGIAALVGAGVLTWAKTSSGLDLPLIGAVKPWQFAFIIVGLPGLIVAAALFLMREPPRQSAPSATHEGSGFGDMLSHVKGNIGAFAGIITLVCVVTIIAYSQGFIPSAFARKFGWEAREYALVNGIIILAVGPATVNIIGALTDKWRAMGLMDAPFRLLAIGFVAMISFNAVALLMPSPVLAFLCLGLGTMAIATCTTTGIIALLDITPAAIRGQVVALYYMIISLAGLLLGPTTVGALSTRVFGEEKLYLAVSAVPALYGLIPLILLPIIRRKYLSQMDQNHVHAQRI